MTSLYDKDIVTFMGSLGFEFHDGEYYKCFTKDEGTCELTYSGAVDLVALIQSQKLAHGEMVIGENPKLGNFDDTNAYYAVKESVDDMRERNK